MILHIIGGAVFLAAVLFLVKLKRPMLWAKITKPFKKKPHA